MYKDGLCSEGDLETQCNADSLDVGGPHDLFGPGVQQRPEFLLLADIIFIKCKEIFIKYHKNRSDRTFNL